MSYCACNIRKVVELWDCEEVNSLLESGWTLLSVGFEGDSDEFHKVYILGSSDQNAPKPPASDFAI